MAPCWPAAIRPRATSTVLSLANELPRITALRLEALPDDSLPKRGPGRIAYEGPFGDFFLSEFTRAARRQERGDQPPPANRSPVATARPPRRSTAIRRPAGRSTAGKAGPTRPSSAGRAARRRQHDRLATVVRDTTTPPGWDDSAFGPPTTRERSRRSTCQPTSRHRCWSPRPSARPNRPSRLMAHFLSIAPELAGERDAIAKLREQMPAFPTTLVMVERPRENPRRTHIHKRGEFLQPTEQVEPQVPSMFAPLAADGPHDRLALARWLVSEQNPLVGRVTVNRHWAALFGRGWCARPRISATRGNRRRIPNCSTGWRSSSCSRAGRIKQLHRLIVTSATYRQSSRATAEMLEQRSAEQAAGPRPARPPRRRTDPRRGAADQRAAVGRSAARASFRRSRPASRPRGPMARSIGRSAKERIAIAAACTRSPSAPRRTRCSRRSTPPAARPAWPGAKSRTRRCNR